MTIKKLRKKLIEFMEWKAEQLKYPEYWDENDSDWLMSLPDDDIVDIASNLDSFSDNDCCIPCIYFERCADCFYGKNHGLCRDFFSDYQTIRNKYNVPSDMGIIGIIGEHLIYSKLKELLGEYF